MGLRETMAKRGPVETVPVPGVGDVKIKRLRWAELAIIKNNTELVQATVLDDAPDAPAGKLWFTDVQAVELADGGLVTVLSQACNQVNLIKVEAALAEAEKK